MQRGFSGVLVLFVVLLLAIGGLGSYYFYNQKIAPKNIGNQNNTPNEQVNSDMVTETFSPVPSGDPTLQWQSFDNLKYGIAFKYPAHYEVEEMKYQNINKYDLRIFTKPVQVEGRGMYVSASIIISKSDIEDLSNDIGGYLFTSGIFNTFTNYAEEIPDPRIGEIYDTKQGYAVKMGEEKIDGLRVVRYNLQQMGNNNTPGIAIRKDAKTINILIYDNSSNQRYEGENLRLILSTLKLTDF